MKKLRRRMILAVCLITTMVFLAVLGMVAAVLTYHYNEQAQSMAELIVRNGGSVPSKKEFDASYENEAPGLELDDETAFRTRYFVVALDEDGTVTDTYLNHIAAVDEDQAMAMADTVTGSGKSSGYLDGYYYQVSAAGDGEEGSSIVFLDCSAEFRSRTFVIEIIGGIMILLVIIVTLLFGIFSKRIIRPFEENNRLQKQFITDASHELKTPLAVISANADVMRYKYGGSAWLDNISCQTKQMGDLIGDLLALTRADEVGTDFAREQVDLVPLVRETWETFRESAEKKQVTMTTDMPESLILEGSTDMLRKLLSVLSENAAKYVTEGGQMELKLRGDRRRVTLQMYNTAQLAENTDYRHLFDRFFRPDSARNSAVGGHGIGLSIARRIADNHRGTITAAPEREGICFTVVLPVK